jgi:peptidoglycan hydrolase-like protein with peptidoglycan-binding domain
MGADVTRHERLGRAGGVVAVAVALLTMASCGDSRDSSQGEETVPRITPTSGVTTLAPTVEAPTTTVAPTTGPTAPPATAFPTSPTPPPTPAPTQPPATQPPATQPPATQPFTTPAPITLPPETPPPPTTAVVVTPGEPALCTDAAVGAATGLLTVSNVSCHAGWAVGHDVTCPATQECEGVDVFHVTSSGWVHDGYFPAMCAEGLVTSGMAIYTAVSFVGALCGDAAGPTEIIRPDSTGERVVQLQTALIAEGYPVAADGTYGPRTEAAVRDYQSRRGLEVDGIAGPQTQAALGIGPQNQPPSGTTTTPATAPPATTSPATTVLPTTTTVVGAGAPVECTAAAIGADIGREVDEVTACHAGWALGQIRSCPGNSACPRADLFRLSESGWAFIRSVRYQCAEDLHEMGMSAYTAAAFASWCGVPNLPSVRLVIEPGSTGIVVEQLQVALVALGYNIAVDGTYGPGTEQAVRDFQSRNGLEVDGIAGPDTREALGV